LQRNFLLHFHSQTDAINCTGFFLSFEHIIGFTAFPGEAENIILFSRPYVTIAYNMTKPFSNHGRHHFFHSPETVHYFYYF